MRLDGEHQRAARRRTRRKAGLTCAVLVPKGKIALGKLAQTLVHGARVLEVDGNFDASLDADAGPRRRGTR